MLEPSEVRAKTFFWTDLLDPPEVITDRLATIEFLTVELGLFPRTWHQHERDVLIQYQARVHGAPPLAVGTQAMRAPLADLAKRLEVMNECGYVHGDISLLNTLWDGTGLFLIDFEPSIRQRHRGKVVLKCPRELRSLVDVAEQTVTSRTDRLAFFLLCCRLMGTSLPRATAEGVHRYRPETERHLVVESEVTALSFTAILDAAVHHTCSPTKEPE